VLGERGVEVAARHRESGEERREVLGDLVGAHRALWPSYSRDPAECRVDEALVQLIAAQVAKPMDAYERLVEREPVEHLVEEARVCSPNLEREEQ
jgi:hypothetical protein